tara:strand:+ start:700 stop:942 length:243 start_codon:yes stop_codon:yes gene_type:complete
MAKNKITDLRNHLFEIIEMLKDEEANSMTIEKAKAIADISQVIINTAKLEIQFIQTTDQMEGMFKTTGFIDSAETMKQIE